MLYPENKHIQGLVDIIVKIMADKLTSVDRDASADGIERITMGITFLWK